VAPHTISVYISPLTRPETEKTVKLKGPPLPLLERGMAMKKTIRLLEIFYQILNSSR